jgi:hypothetical protein
MANDGKGIDVRGEVVDLLLEKRRVGDLGCRGELRSGVREPAGGGDLGGDGRVFGFRALDATGTV